MRWESKGLIRCSSLPVELTLAVGVREWSRSRNSPLNFLYLLTDGMKKSMCVSRWQRATVILQSDPHGDPLRQELPEAESSCSQQRRGSRKRFPGPNVKGTGENRFRAAQMQSEECSTKLPDRWLNKLLSTPTCCNLGPPWATACRSDRGSFCSCTLILPRLLGSGPRPAHDRVAGEPRFRRPPWSSFWGPENGQKNGAQKG